jgi:signal peptidase II
MNTKGIIRVFVVLLIIIVNIGCDQVSKRIVRRNVAPDQTFSMLNDHLTVTHAENTGAFLSLGDSMPKTAKNVLLSVLPLLALAFGFYYTITKRNISKTTVVGLCFIMGGGAGNIFDRIVYGSVTDFLHIKLGIFQTGIFNLADLSIVTGTLILLLNSFLKKKKKDMPGNDCIKANN